MSTGTDDEFAVDDPSSEEVSHEVLGPEDKNPSSEETSSDPSAPIDFESSSVASTDMGFGRTLDASVAMRSETFSGASATGGDFPGSEEIASQLSRETDGVTIEIPSAFEPTVLSHIEVIDIPVEYLRDVSSGRLRTFNEYRMHIANRRIKNYYAYGSTKLQHESGGNTPQRPSTAVGDSSDSEEITSVRITNIENLNDRMYAVENIKTVEIDLKCLIDLILNHVRYRLTQEQLDIAITRVANYYTYNTMDYLVESGENFPERPSEENVSPTKEVAPQVQQAPPKQVNLLKRVWLQRGPLKAYYKKYPISLFLAQFFCFTGLVLLFLRFAPFPDPIPLTFSIFGGAIIIVRNTLMHLFMPVGPPYRAKENGDPIYEPARLKRIFDDPEARKKFLTCRYFCPWRLR